MSCEINFYCTVRECKLLSSSGLTAETMIAIYLPAAAFSSSRHDAAPLAEIPLIWVGVFFSHKGKSNFNDLPSHLRRLFIVTGR